jgi:hypothetical protein
LYRRPLVDLIGISVICLVLLLIVAVAARVIRGVRWDRHLRADGTRVPGVVAVSTQLYPRRGSRPPGVRIRVTIPSVPGLIALKLTDHMVPEGTPVTVAYDPARTRRRPLVIDEDL